MIVKPSNSASGRRGFLLSALPAGTLFCLGCGNLSAMANRQNTKKTDEKMHKFHDDSGLTMREVFRFAYQWSYIPMMQALADKMGREKLIGLLKEANDTYIAQWIGRASQAFPQKDFSAFFRMDMLEAVTDNQQHKQRFWSLANTAQTIEETPNSYEMKVIECLWSQTFREANAGDIGFASICYADEAIAAAFDQRLKLTRTKALMKGDDCCHFRWVWEA